MFFLFIIFELLPRPKYIGRSKHKILIGDQQKKIGILFFFLFDEIEYFDPSIRLVKKKKECLGIFFSNLI
jgi:hypothetical protein